ncbi:hypothetical protein F4825DRAFT_429161 [Nemania diffusa]|nr:hypothetical protein F4825DRAFT_429161 [Nemania diffusa]
MKNKLSSLRPINHAPARDGLPAPSSPPFKIANKYELAQQQQNEPFFSPPASIKATHHASPIGATTPSVCRVHRDKYHRRLYELQDELYPLKLVQELNRISDEPHFPGRGKYTAKAANNRVLDVWNQKYGTGTSTGTLSSDKTDKRFMGFEQGKMPEGYSPLVSPGQTLDYPSLGGVLADNSHWEIKNSCLSLSHKSDEGEKTVYVVLSRMRRQGIHG